MNILNHDKESNLKENRNKENNQKENCNKENNLKENQNKENNLKENQNKENHQKENHQKENHQKENYQKEMDKIIHNLKQPKTLLLHSCCAPCSSYCLEYLSDFFSITVFYFNPNISSTEEYQKRVSEQKRFITAFNEKAQNKISIMEGDYRPETFYQYVKGYEQCKEGGERCALCFDLRLRETAKVAKQDGFDYFTTTLTISPLKNAEKINEIGRKLEREMEVDWLPSDFKKREGYKRSIELSKEYGLYRQNFCGCSFSKLAQT